MLKIGKESFERIAKAAQLAVPDEACGLIIGRHDGGGKGGKADKIIVSSVRPSPNLARNRGEYFEIDPSIHIHLQRELRENGPEDGKGDEIVGVYHSHPGGHAFPSREDVAQANYPGWVWVITAVRKDDGLTKTAAFLHIEGGGNSHLPAKFKEIKIEVGE